MEDWVENKTGCWVSQQVSQHISSVGECCPQCQHCQSVWIYTDCTNYIRLKQPCVNCELIVLHI